MHQDMLGLPLAEALRRLDAAGIHPQVTISRAPRRPEGVGALRVVRIREDGADVTACAFVDAMEGRDEG